MWSKDSCVNNIYNIEVLWYCPPTWSRAISGELSSWFVSVSRTQFRINSYATVAVIHIEVLSVHTHVFVYYLVTLPSVGFYKWSKHSYAKQMFEVLSMQDHFTKLLQTCLAHTMNLVLFRPTQLLTLLYLFVSHSMSDQRTCHDAINNAILRIPYHTIEKWSSSQPF